MGSLEHGQRVFDWDVHVDIVARRDDIPAAASQIMDAVLKGAQNAVASAKINVDQLTGAAMKQVEEAAGDATKALEDATGGAGGAGDAVKGLIKGFGK